MIESLGNRAARDLWETDETKLLPKSLWLRAKALMTIMYNTERLEDLKILGQPPGIRLHKLKGDLKEYWSVTIELPWCLIFRFKSGRFSDVKVINYHKG